MNLACFNNVMIFLIYIYMELIWWRENLNLFPDVWNQSNFLSINNDSWNKVDKTHDQFLTLIYLKVLNTWSHTSFDNIKNVKLNNQVGYLSMRGNENLTQFSSSGNPSPNA